MSASAGDDAAARPARRSDAPSRAAAPRWHAALLLLVLAAALLAGVLSRGVTPPVDAGAPEDVFSAERASRAVAGIVDAPRPVGSPANDAAREELAAQLRDLGFATEVQEGIGSRRNGDEVTAGYVRNLVASRPGSDPTGTIVLATHIDSVPNAPGAADAGVGLAVILETVRALGPEAQRNDLVVLLVDGEERGLLGAEAHVDGPAAELAEPVVVLNHEARGVSGRPLVTRAAGPMHAVIGSAPHPEFESFTEAVFAIIPNYTDFSTYRDAGWWGMDMAIIDDAWAYHSAQDDAAHLDPGTLQHYGELTLALTRDLGARDLAALAERADEHPVQTTAPWGVIALPPWTVTVLGVLAPLAVLAAMLIRRRRGELSVPGVLTGAVMTLLVLPAAIVAAFLLWQTTADATPQMLSQTTREPVRAELFLLAELLAATAVATAGWVLARLLISRTAALLGASLAVTALLAVLAVASPALGVSMILPAAIAALAVLPAALLCGVPGLLLRAVALLPTGWLLGTQLSALAEFGIASAAGGLAGTALIALGAAGALLVASPADGARPARRLPRLLVPVLPAVLAVGAAVGGTAWTLAAPEPTQARVTAHVEAGSGATTWDVTGTTAWGRALDDTTATSTLEMPTATRHVTADGRLEIRIDAPRDASAYTLEAEDGLLREIAVDGQTVHDGAGVEAVTVHGVRAGQSLTLTVGADPQARLSLVETSYDPSLAAGWDPPGEDISLMQPRLEVSLPVSR